jgi:hypothetical protein
MFINIGAFIAPLTTNFIVGVHHLFIAILIRLIMFLTLKKILTLPNKEAVGIIPRYIQEINKKDNNLLFGGFEEIGWKGYLQPNRRKIWIFCCNFDK